MAIAVDLEEGGEGGMPYFYQADGTELELPLDAENARWGAWAWDDAAWSPVDPTVIAVAELYREFPPKTLTSEFAWSLVLFNTRTKLEQPLFDAPHPPPSPDGQSKISMVSWPSWSPDGKKLAFCRQRWAGPGKPSIWTVGAEDQGARKVADNAAEPAWRPWTAGSDAEP
jgi:Tol biopolymer transport system component